MRLIKEKMPYIKREQFYLQHVGLPLKLVCEALFVEKGDAVGHPSITYTNVDEQEFAWAEANRIVYYA